MNLFKQKSEQRRKQMAKDKKDKQEEIPLIYEYEEARDLFQYSIIYTDCQKAIGVIEGIFSDFRINDAESIQLLSSSLGAMHRAFTIAIVEIAELKMRQGGINPQQDRDVLRQKIVLPQG
jgi:hypothetical protein